MQEIVLCGLSRGGFFQNTAFYSGTALRIFHGLDRFSEDLDFSLKKPDPSFDLLDYIPSLEKEIRSYGVNFKIETKEKTADSNIKSAFLKGNTKEHLMMFFPNEPLANTVGSGELIKIKFEVDINPPDYATYETKYRLIPIPYEVTLYDMPSLFAGKLHAVICRSWKNRVKGRDLYDYIFYLSKGTSVNLKHLVARLAQSGYIPSEKEITLEDIKEMLRNRFRSIDYAQAKQDVEPFIKNPKVLDIWSADFFCGITDSLQKK
ncbi:nucleotidyl transferase AbiEii/AbiGii toxin family protein [Alkalibacter rhizosphaerae]|uniref:nucleotidyl transferase AbiEii/AbiGii toxin family protein n=1 Tax=Alkalibacter rhizosphaerae TaxID=2815577 RepID=UPI001FEE37D7|nr:nucleotidyl transferase AbiEii/AbiGii toxin family protein [Alkalibacter rhizosphaerae]